MYEMVEENKGVLRDNGDGDSHRVWSTSEGRRTRYGGDQKSYKHDAGNILVMRAGDDSSIV